MTVRVSDVLSGCLVVKWLLTVLCRVFLLLPCLIKKGKGNLPHGSYSLGFAGFVSILIMFGRGCFE